MTPSKGAKQLIGKQSDLVPTFAGKGEQYPDIDHFIKCISGALFKLAGDNGLGGNSLLEPARIKTICSDILKSIYKYGLYYKQMFDQTATQEEQTAKLDEQHAAAIVYIASIIPHHCGDHTNTSFHFKMKQT